MERVLSVIVVVLVLYLAIAWVLLPILLLSQLKEIARLLRQQERALAALVAQGVTAKEMRGDLNAAAQWMIDRAAAAEEKN